MNEKIDVVSMLLNSLMSIDELTDKEDKDVKIEDIRDVVTFALGVFGDWADEEHGLDCLWDPETEQWDCPDEEDYICPDCEGTENQPERHLKLVPEEPN